MADEPKFKLTPDVRKTEQGDHYQVGYDVNGVWVPVAMLNAPDFELRLQEAEQAAEDAKTTKK